MISPDLRALSGRHHMDPNYYQSNAKSHTILKTGTSPRLPPRRPPPPPPREPIPRDIPRARDITGARDFRTASESHVTNRSSMFRSDPLGSPRTYYRNNFIITLDKDSKEDTSAKKFHTFCKKTSQRLSISKRG